jgi:hypothetical protein
MPESGGTNFVFRRAEALALVLLTGRPDITMVNAPENSGIDLIVTILKKKVHSFDQFGVIVRGTVREIPSPEGASKVLNSLLRPKTSRVALSMPVCAFFFSMVDDRGYYAWVKEPITVDGVPRLRHPAKIQCRRLGPESLQEIVECVDIYSQALSKTLVG